MKYLASALLALSLLVQPVTVSAQSSTSGMTQTQILAKILELQAMIETLRAQLSAKGVTPVVAVANEDTLLQVRESDEDPDDSLISLEEDDTSDAYVVFAFEVESLDDINVDMIPVTLNISDNELDFTEVVSDVWIEINNKEYGLREYNGHFPSSRFPKGRSVNMAFDMRGVPFAANQPTEVFVVMEFNEAQSLPSNLLIQAEMRRDDVEDIEVNGDDINGQTIGEAHGSSHMLLAEAITLEAQSMSARTIGEGIESQTAEFTAVMEVMALGSDIYIQDVKGGESFEFKIESSNTTVGRGATSHILSSTAERSQGNFIVREGETEQFTYKVNYAPESDGVYSMQIEGLSFSYTPGGNIHFLEAIPEEDFETDAVFVDVKTQTNKPELSVSSRTVAYDGAINVEVKNEEGYNWSVRYKCSSGVTFSIKGMEISPGCGVTLGNNHVILGSDEGKLPQHYKIRNSNSAKSTFIIELEYALPGGAREKKMETITVLPGKVEDPISKPVIDITSPLSNAVVTLGQEFSVKWTASNLVLSKYGVAAGAVRSFNALTGDRESSSYIEHKNGVNTSIQRLDNPGTYRLEVHTTSQPNDVSDSVTVKVNPVVTDPTITSFTATQTSESDKAVKVAWNTSSEANVHLSVFCEHPITLKTDEGDTINCDGNLDGTHITSWNNDNSSTIRLYPVGNTHAVFTDLTLRVERPNSSPSTQEKTVVVVFQVPPVVQEPFEITSVEKYSSGGGTGMTVRWNKMTNATQYRTTLYRQDINGSAEQTYYITGTAVSTGTHYNAGNDLGYCYYRRVIVEALDASGNVIGEDAVDSCWMNDGSHGNHPGGYTGGSVMGVSTVNKDSLKAKVEAVERALRILKGFN